MNIFYKKLFLATFIFIGLFSVSFGSVLHAAQLVTCGNAAVDTSTGIQSDECTVCDLQVLAMNVLNFFVLISTVVGALLFFNAGFLYVTSPSNPGNISKAHSIFTSTLVGIIIILAAWLIINTIMVGLLNTGGPLGAWNNVLCVPPTGSSALVGPSAPTASGTVTPPSTTTSGAPVSASTGTVTKAEAEAALAGKVPITHTATGVTYVEGLQKTTLDGVVTLANQSGLSPSEIMITGGTEPGHSTTGTLTHSNGYKVDFQDTPAMNSYIEGSFVNTGTFRDGDPVYTTTINGRPVEAVKESTHWDFTFL